MAPLAPRFTEVAHRIRQPISPQQTILANGGRAPQVQSVSKMNFSKRSPPEHCSILQKQLCQQLRRRLAHLRLGRRDPLVQRREQQHTLLARNGRLHDRLRPLQQMLRLCTYPRAQLRTVTRGEHKIHTKLRIGIGDRYLLPDVVHLMDRQIGTKSVVPQPLCMKVITLQRQHTRVQPPVRRKQHLSIFTDLLDTTSRKACCRIIYQNWNRIELRSVRRYAPYSIACQNHRCTTSQKRCPKQRIPAKCDQRQRQQAKCQHKRSDRKSRTPPLPSELLIKHFRHTAPLPSRRQNGLSLHKKHDETAKDRSQMTAVFCVGIDLSSRSVSRQVLSALVSLTSVFGMGTGGPSPLETPTIDPRGTPQGWYTIRDSNPGHPD